MFMGVYMLIMKELLVVRLYIYTVYSMYSQLAVQYLLENLLDLVSLARYYIDI
jgi:hypothetical protein